MASHLYAHTRHHSDEAFEIETLLLRYPDLDMRELETLIELFPRLPMIDVALMTADDRLSDPLAAFHRDHGDKFYTPIRVLMALLAGPLFAAAILWWLMG
ncbi:MAG: hypothetical protein ABIO86_16180 [Sphingomonas sp.]